MNVGEDLEVPRLLRKWPDAFLPLPLPLPHFWLLGFLVTSLPLFFWLFGSTQDTDAGGPYLLMSDTHSLLSCSHSLSLTHTHPTTTTSTSTPTFTSPSPSNRTKCLASWTKLEEAGRQGRSPSGQHPPVDVSLSPSLEKQQSPSPSCGEIWSKGWVWWAAGSRALCWGNREVGGRGPWFLRICARWQPARLWSEALPAAPPGKCDFPLSEADCAVWKLALF